MDPSLIAELLTPFLPSAALTQLQLLSISTYIDLLLRWNARVNLTAIRDPRQIVARHFGESLFAARHLFPDPGLESAAVIDLGSGAGFPGIPIKIWAPHLLVTLIESNQKKAIFLREVCRATTLTDIDIVSGRAEAYAGPPASTVTLRAVERFPSALPIARRLLVPGGRLALLIGSSQSEQARAILPDLTWSEAIPLPMSNSRILLLGTALREPRQ